jgi:NTE family protein
MAGLSRTRRSNGSRSPLRARTPWRFRWISGAREASCRAVSSRSTRHKEIQYSSRTRANTDRFKEMQQIRYAIAGLLDKLPEELRGSTEAKVLSAISDRKVYNLAHLIYQPRNNGHSKDYEFSRLSMQDHWRAGYHDTVRTLRHSEVLDRPKSRDGVFIFDLHRDGRE